MMVDVIESAALSSVHPIDEAARLLGLSLERFGQRLGVTKSAVSQWKQPGRVVPAEHCPVIERLTQGRVRCEALNNRIDWAALRRSTVA